MIWSISGYKSFQRCQRKWYFDEKVGSRSKKDAFRNEVYLLSQLEGIDAWRGKIVDFTISEFVIPKLSKKQNIVEDDVIAFAKKLSRDRYNFAKAQRYKEDELKKSDHEYDYAALYPFEYINARENLTEKFTKAWEEIEIALRNFLGRKELLEYLQTSNYLMTQRALQYPLHNFTIKGVPDLIAFFPDRAPHIIDWKVHFWGTKTYNEQLLVYAIALKNCKPHADFPADLSKYALNEIRLTEYQLLKNTVRDYEITDTHVEEVNDFIADGISRMKLCGCTKGYAEINIDEFERTQNFDHCNYCQFKKICKSN